MLGTTETCLDTATKLKRIAWLSASDPDKRFECLMHLFNEESLAACFHELDGTKAVGIDGMTKAQYGEELEANLEELVARMKRMAYRPQPVRFSKQEKRRGEKAGAFDFLGFTFYLGRTRRGAVIPKLKTSGKRLRSKLKRVDEWAGRVRNVLPLKQLWALFQAKLRGHIQYYGVSFNIMALNRFVYQATRILFRHLNRRSQRKSFNWEQFARFKRAYPLPSVRIRHALF